MTDGGWKHFACVCIFVCLCMPAQTSSSDVALAADDYSLFSGEKPSAEVASSGALKHDDSSVSWKGCVCGRGSKGGGGVFLWSLLSMSFINRMDLLLQALSGRVRDNLGSTWQLHLSESGMGSLEIMMQPPPAAKQVSKFSPCVRLRMCVHAYACACACLCLCLPACFSLATERLVSSVRIACVARYLAPLICCINLLPRPGRAPLTSPLARVARKSC